MADLPRITVIICPRNHAAVLERAIQSVLDQNYPDLELMVIDADSTDGTAQVIENFSDRLHWSCSRRVTGEPHAINIGLDKATGDLITLLSADAWYPPEALCNVGAFFEQHPETDFLYGRSQVVDERGELLHRHLGNIYTLEDLLDVWNVWWKGRSFRPSECFWSKRVLLKSRSFREHFLYAFAYEYWTRLFQTGAGVARFDEDVCCFPRRQELTAEEEAVKQREELQVIKPILWNPDVRLDKNMRRRLQADWLFRMRFLPALEESADAGETPWQRLLTQSKTIAAHPGILLSEEFREWRKSPSTGGDLEESRAPET